MRKAARGRIVASLLLASASSTALGQSYEVRDLGAQAVPQDVNNHGHVTGFVRDLDLGRTDAFVDRGAGPELLPSPSGRRTRAFAINDAGDVVGDGQVEDNGVFPTRALVWRGEQVFELGTLTLGSRFATSSAFDVDESGRAVGLASVPALPPDFFSRQHAALFTGGAATDLDLPEELESTLAAGINASGVVVGGTTAVDGSNGVAFRVQVGLPVQRLGAPPGFTSSFAQDVNDDGRIVGSASGPDVPTQAVTWDGEWHLLGSLGGIVGDIASAAAAINAAGDVVGSAYTMDGEEHGVIWRGGGGLFDLNNLLDTPGWEIIRATGINDVGQIVGEAKLDGSIRGVLLTPTTTTPPACDCQDPCLTAEPDPAGGCEVVPGDVCPIVCREQAPVCEGETLPAGVRRRYDRARRLAARAASDPTRAAVYRRRFVRVLREAARIAVRRARHGHLSGECAAALAVR